MHTRQDAARPALPDVNLDLQVAQLRELLAPNWAPLEKLCPPGLCEQFMFMGKIDGVHLYKHVDSRRYLNVDAFGVTYSYNAVSSTYSPISVVEAMQLLAGPDRCVVSGIVAMVDRARARR